MVAQSLSFFLYMDAFIEHQVKLVEKEKQIDVEDTLQLLSSFTPIQLQKRGVALIGLKVTGKLFLLQLASFCSLNAGYRHANRSWRQKVKRDMDGYHIIKGLTMGVFF